MLCHSPPTWWSGKCKSLHLLQVELAAQSLGPGPRLPPWIPWCFWPCTLGSSGHFPCRDPNHSLFSVSIPWTITDSITTHCARKLRSKWLCRYEGGRHRMDSPRGAHVANPLFSPCKQPMSPPKRRSTSVAMGNKKSRDS